MEIIDNICCAHTVHPAPNTLLGLEMGPDTGSLWPCLLGMGEVPTVTQPSPLNPASGRR